MGAEIAAGAAELGVAVAQSQLANRVVYAETLGLGLGAIERPNGPATVEMAALTDEILARIG